MRKHLDRQVADALIVGLTISLTVGAAASRPAESVGAVEGIEMGSGQPVDEAPVVGFVDPELPSATNPDPEFANRANIAAIDVLAAAPGDVTGWSVGGNILTIRFKSSMSDASRKVLDSAGLPYTVVEDVGFSGDELADLTRAAHEEVRSLLGGGVALESWPEVGDDVSIVVRVQEGAPTETARSATPPDVSVLAAAAESAVPGVDVAVEYAPDVAAEEERWGGLVVPASEPLTGIFVPRASWSRSF